MPNLVELIKKAAVEAVYEAKPTAIVFGKVVSVSPLSVYVEQKIILTTAQLILTNNAKELVTNDEVVLLQMQGGQRFIVLDKVVAT